MWISHRPQFPFERWKFWALKSHLRPVCSLMREPLQGASQPMISNGCCPAKTHSTKQPNAPVHPPHNQHFSSIQAVYIGTHSVHLSWKIRCVTGLSDGLPQVQTLTEPQSTPCAPPPPIPASESQLDAAPNSGRTTVLCCTTNQSAVRWETYVQVMSQPLPLTGCCPSRIHSTAQPQEPEYTPHGQPSPVTSAVHIVIGTKPVGKSGTCPYNNSWKNRHRQKIYYLEEKLSKHHWKNTFNNLKSSVSPWEPSNPQITKSESAIVAETQKNKLKNYFMEIIEDLKKEIKNSLNKMLRKR